MFSALFGFFWLQISFLPPQKEIFPELDEIRAESAIVYDATQNTILFERNADEHRAIASLTKLITAAVTLHFIDEEKKITVTSEARNHARFGTMAGLDAGDEFLRSDLLKFLLIDSASDAAEALAHSLGREKFIEKMNLLAILWGIWDSHFINPTGFDTEGHFSTARDLLKLSRRLWKNEEIRKIVGARDAHIVSEKNKKWFALRNTNTLLFYPRFEILGMKTGTSDKAGECLIAVAKIHDHEIFIILLDSPDRFADAHFTVNFLSQKLKK